MRPQPRRSVSSLLEQLELGRRVLVVGAAPDLRATVPTQDLVVSFVDTEDALDVYAGTGVDVVVLDASSWSARVWRAACSRLALDSVPAIVVLGDGGRESDADAYDALDVVARPLRGQTLARRLHVAAEVGRHRRAAVVAEAALSATGCGITVADAHQADLPLIYASVGFERITGYSASEVRGRNCRFLQGGDADARAVEQLRAAVRHGQSTDVRLRNHRADGTAFWNDLSIRPVIEAGGRLRYLLGVQRDVSAQVDAEALLASDQSTTFLDMVLEELPAGVLTADSDGRTTFVNRAGLSTLELAPHQALGRPLQEVLRCPPDLLLEGGRRRRHEYVIQAASGRDIILGLTITPTRGAHAKIQWFVLFRDLGPDREAEQTHRRVERLAAIGTMVAGFAHEVRNPVTAMRSLLENLDDELPAPDPRRIYAAKLIKHLERVERLVKGSLTFGRPDIPRKTRVSPVRLVDEALEQMRPRVGTLGAIRRVVADDLPDIDVDELHLTQVLVALLNNAVDATASPDQVTIRASFDGDAVCFTVEDNGPGIPRHVLGRMFDPFFTTKASGSGLGLSIAQRLVHDNGASIDANSTLGRGAQLIVRIAPAQREAS